MYVAREESDVADFCLLAKEEMESVMSRIDRSGEGVCVQASTLGSLEALLDFLKTPEVAVHAIITILLCVYYEDKL